jgi:hypothetical protein
MRRDVALLKEPMILLVLGFALFGTRALARWHMNNLLEREEMEHHPLRWTEPAYARVMRERGSTTLAARDNSYLPTRRCHFGVSWIIAGEMKAADVSA